MPSAARFSIQGANPLAGHVREDGPGRRGRDVVGRVLRLEQEHGHLGARHVAGGAVAAAGAPSGDSVVKEILDERVEGVARHVREAVADVEGPRLGDALVDLLLELRVPVLCGPPARVGDRDDVARTGRVVAVRSAARQYGAVIRGADVDVVGRPRGPREIRRRPRDGDAAWRAVRPRRLDDDRLARFEHAIEVGHGGRVLRGNDVHLRAAYAVSPDRAAKAAEASPSWPSLDQTDRKSPAELLSTPPFDCESSVVWLTGNSSVTAFPNRSYRRA